MPRLLKIFTVLSLAFFVSLFLYILLLPGTIFILDEKKIENCQNVQSWNDIPAFKNNKPIQYPHKFQNASTELSFHSNKIHELVFAGTSGQFSLEGSLHLKTKPCLIKLQLSVSSGLNPVTKLFLEPFANQAGADILDLFS